MIKLTKTHSGAVRGLACADNRISVFKGIPFADDTSGENRWKAPQPAKSWDGVRECYEFGPLSMQKIQGDDANNFYAKEWNSQPGVEISEDSLRANIWTPAKSTDEKLPVMVWIFGGGYKEGFAHEMEFDGERIARRGVVFVSISYRLNVFGFLAHPDITAENPDAPTNFGLLDQRFGIEWVKNNIANFGGDPDNITIFGQSAGGGSVTYHLCAPGNDGLFQRAIIQSFGGVTPKFPPSPFPPNKSLSEAEAIGEKFFKESLGVSSLEEARKLDGKFILDKFLETGLWLEVVIDDKYVLREFSDTIRQGGMMKVPVIIGHNGGESVVGPGMGFMSGASNKPQTYDDIKNWVDSNFGKHADDYLALCKKLAGSDDTNALLETVKFNNSELAVSLMCETRAAQGEPVYYYCFNPTMPGDNAGAFHSSDIWFEFETLSKCWRPFDGHHYDLARKMCNYWTNFAKYGDPNGSDADGKPMPKWEKYTTEDPVRIEFFDDISVRHGKLNDKMQFLIDNNFADME